MNSEEGNIQNEADSKHLTPGASGQRVRCTSSGLRPVDSPAPAGSVVPALADGQFLSPLPKPLKSHQGGAGNRHGGGEGGTPGARRHVPAWWLEVPDAEKAVIRDVLTAIRGLKGSRSPQVGQAARKWERSIACFIRFRLIGEKQKMENRKLRWEHAVLASSVNREKAPRAKR